MSMCCFPLSEKVNLKRQKKMTSFCVLLMAGAAVAVDLPVIVPAPREMKVGGGMYVIEPQIRYSMADWHDFDRVGQALSEMKKTVVRDASFPAEGYRLKVMADGVAIAAADAAGEFYALQTLRQLAVADGTNAVSLACCEIADWPAYRWRGLLIDEARHFFGKDIVKRILDQMAVHKLNVLHWHLTDDQGWRLEIPGMPELIKYGSRRPESVKYGAVARWLPPKHALSYETDGQPYGPYFYTQTEIAEIRAYAKERHITIVPEIELPGHARAFLAAYPELACKGETLPRVPRVYWSIEEDVMCVGNEALLPRLERIFDAVCELFPDSPYIHIGGDECPRSRWKNCPKCQARMKAEGIATEDGLQTWCTSRMVRYLEKKGRRAVGWDEVLSGDVPVSTIGMTWRTGRGDGAGTHYVTTAEAVVRGYEIVMTPMDFCYHSKSQGLVGDPYPYYSPWGMPLTLEKAYAFDPVAGISRQDRMKIIGGQACVWGEAVWNVFDFEWKTWPRACATAEALWLGDAKPGYADFRKRMEQHRRRLLARHVNCAPLP